MATILDFSSGPISYLFLIDERLSLVKISFLLPKWHNSPKNMHQTAGILRRQKFQRIGGTAAERDF